MSVSAEDFFSLSKRLLEGTDEIDYRSAVSRAYYSAYHAASETADKLGLPKPRKEGAGAHEQMIARFEAGGPGLKKFGRRLRDRKRVRAVADYQLGEQMPKVEAQLFLREIEHLLNDIARIGRTRVDTAESPA